MKFGFSIAQIIALVMGLCSPASANVIYQFNGTVSGGSNGPFIRQLVVTDAAFAAGIMNFSIMNPGINAPNTCGPAQLFACIVSGDPSGFVSLTFADFLPPTLRGYFFDLGLRFNPDGTLSGGITDTGQDETLRLSGSEFDWSGSLSADYPVNNGHCDADFPNNCQIQGYFQATNLPEPITLSLFGAGLAGTVVVRRRQKKLA